MEGLNPDQRVKIGEAAWLSAGHLYPSRILSPVPAHFTEVQTLRLYRDISSESPDSSRFRVDFLDAPLVRRLDVSGLVPGPGAGIRVLFSPEYTCSRLECQIAFDSGKSPLVAHGQARLFGDEWEVFLFESDWSSWLRITLTAFPG